MDQRVPPQPVAISCATADPPASSWGLPTLLAFRFAFVYLLLYCLPSPLTAFPYGEWLGDRYDELARIPIVWFASAVLDIQITIFPAGSGDTTFNYVQILVFALVATMATVVWTAIAGRRHPPLLRDRLHIYLRFVLAVTLVHYGSVKVLQAQFPPLEPARLAVPLGEMSPMGLLWDFMSYSKGYGFFTGAVEVLGGVLLFWRRTTTLGALVVAGAMANVFALNLSYDVCVKLYSFHLLAIAVVLLVPDAGRLVDVFILHRPVAPTMRRAPFGWRQLERARRPMKAIAIVVLLGTAAYQAYEAWKTRGGGAEVGPGEGYYEVQTFLRGGVVQPRNLDDASQWRSLTVSRYGYAVLRTMKGRPRGYDLVRIPLVNIMVIVRVRPGEASYGWLLFRREGADRLAVRGLFDGVPIEAHMKRNDGTTTELMSRGFHWINEYPYNR
jgi:hypothetical protein